MHLEIKGGERTFSIIDLSDDDAQKLCALIGGVMPVSGGLYSIWSELDRELKPRTYTLRMPKGGRSALHMTAPYLEHVSEDDDGAED